MRKIVTTFETGARSYRTERLPDDATLEEQLIHWARQSERKYHTAEEVADMALRAACDVYRREGLDPDASATDLRTLSSASGKEEGGAAYWAARTAADALDLVEAKRAGDIDAVARCAWRAASSYERLMAAAYPLKSLGLTLADIEVKGRKKLTDSRNGADQTIRITRDRAREKAKVAVKRALGELELPLPAGHNKWTLELLASQVFAVWPDHEKRPALSTIKSYLKKAVDSDGLTIPA
jgi:hypothetical protein